MVIHEPAGSFEIASGIVPEESEVVAVRPVIRHLPGGIVDRSVAPFLDCDVPGHVWHEVDQVPSLVCHGRVEKFAEERAMDDRRREKRAVSPVVDHAKSRSDLVADLDDHASPVIIEVPDLIDQVPDLDDQVADLIESGPRPRRSHR